MSVIEGTVNKDLSTDDKIELFENRAGIEAYDKIQRGI